MNFNSETGAINSERIDGTFGAQQHRQRVAGEAAELKGKLDKLNTFLGSESFKRLSELERDLLHAQAVVMCQYHEILLARIDAF